MDHDVQFELRKEALKPAIGIFFKVFFWLLIPVLVYQCGAWMFAHDPLHDRNGCIPPKDSPVARTQSTGNGTMVVQVPVNGKCVRLDKNIKKGQWLQLVTAEPVGVNISAATVILGLYPKDTTLANLTATRITSKGAEFVRGKRNKDTVTFVSRDFAGSARWRPASLDDNYGALVFVLDNHSHVIDVGTCVLSQSKQPIHAAVNVIPNEMSNRCTGYFLVEFRILDEFCGTVGGNATLRFDK